MQDTTLQLTAPLLAADDGNVFFYAALVFIAFVSWVVGRIKEAIARFQAVQRDKSRQLQQRRHPSSPASSTAPAASPPAPPVMSQKERTQAALRATYQALGIPLPDEETTVAATVDPDDLLTRDEREALRQQKQQRAAEKPRRSAEAKPVVAKKQEGLLRPKDSYTLKARGRETRDPSALRKMLRDRTTIRQAILLKEILDPPKALRKDQ